MRTGPLDYAGFTASERKHLAFAVRSRPELIASGEATTLRPSALMTGLTIALADPSCREACTGVAVSEARGRLRLHDFRYEGHFYNQRVLVNGDYGRSSEIYVFGSDKGSGLTAFGHVSRDLSKPENVGRFRDGAQLLAALNKNPLARERVDRCLTQGELSRLRSSEIKLSQTGRGISGLSIGMRQ
jgi:hypothetical protein